MTNHWALVCVKHNRKPKTPLSFLPSLLRLSANYEPHLWSSQCFPAFQLASQQQSWQSSSDSSTLSADTQQIFTSQKQSSSDSSNLTADTSKLNCDLSADTSSSQVQASQTANNHTCIACQHSQQDSHRLLVPESSPYEHDCGPFCSS